MKEPLIPVAEVAIRLAMSRERAIRLIQTGRLPGGLKGGRWFAELRGIERLCRERAGRDPVPA